MSALTFEDAEDDTTLAAQTAEGSSTNLQAYTEPTELSELWEACLKWAEGESDGNEKIARVCSVIDLMDSQLDPVKVLAARDTELAKLFDDFATFGWTPKSVAAKNGWKPQHYTWVDQKKWISTSLGSPARM